MRISPSDLRAWTSGARTSTGDPAQAYTGHPHFWQRAISRRAVVQTAAGTMAVLGSTLAMPGLAQAHGSLPAPRPIPETLFGNTPFHIQFPDSVEPSSITDFNGFVGATEIQGHLSGDLVFDADMRFMQGTYVAVDGTVHHHTFGFV